MTIFTKRREPLTPDQRWHMDGKRNGWALPPPAARWKRLPVIRHVRAFRELQRVERHYRLFEGGMGLVRTGYDEWVLYAIWRGWC